MAGGWMVLLGLLAGQHLSMPAVSIGAELPLATTAIGSVDAVRWLEALGVEPGAGPTRRERLIVLAADRRVVKVVDGQDSRVALSAELDALLLQPGAGLCLVHNHPGGNGLSPNDLGQLEKGNVNAVIAIGHDGSVYTASRGSRFSATAPAGLAAIYEQARRGAERVLRGERDPRLRAAYDSQLQHVLSQALADAGIIAYQARLGDDRRASFNDARLFLARVRAAAKGRLERQGGD